jgi:predicted CoA-substrate-specific enzyme activase
MPYAGLDVGSRTIKLVVGNSGTFSAVTVPTGVKPLERCQELLAGYSTECLVVTGYGRLLVGNEFIAHTVSEIKAHALGARHLTPDCRTVIDVGGQDCKVIQLNEAGNVQKFEMNDRCAAGTGKFLEVMAGTLEVDIGHLGNMALTATREVRINSLCTVFAESEVVSLIARGEESAAIAKGLHEAIAQRIATMARRLGIKERVVFSGGGALNPCLVNMLEEKLGIPISVAPEPQIVGALGAYLLAEAMAAKPSLQPANI